MSRNEKKKRGRRFARTPAKIEANGTSATTGDGTPPASRDDAGSMKPGSKISRVVALLQNPCGATLQELVVATGWLPHTTRAALTGLKKKGHTITSEKAEGERRYRTGAT